MSFRLPEEGASGLFQNNSKTELTATAADGRASVWGMRWGKIGGVVTVRITAAKGSTRAGTTATQIISSEVPAGNAVMTAGNRKVYSSRGGGGKKWLWFGLAAAGAAGGGFAAYEVMKGGTASAGAVATAGATTISAPSVSVGPH